MIRVLTRVATMDGQSPKCPKCGEANCSRVMPRHGMAIGWLAFAVALIVIVGVGLVFKEFLSPAWAPLVVIPLFFATFWAVDALCKYLFGMSWRCSTCHSKFRFENAQ